MIRGGRRLAFWLGVVGGLAGSLLFGVVSVLDFGPVGALMFLVGFLVGVPPAIVPGFIIGLVVGFISWVETPMPSDRASTPMTTWRADRPLNLLRSIVLVLLGGLVAKFLGGIIGIGVEMQAPRGTVSLGTGREDLSIAIVLAIVVVLGFLAGGRHAWMAYFIATYRLAWKRRLPRRLMPFLDDAHRLGLLRAVGPVYQFRHADLQDHLAATYQPPGYRVGTQ
jgi:hypothetical protein